MNRLSLVAASLVAGFCTGCWMNAARSQNGQDPGAQGPIFADPAAMRADALPYESARLILAGTEVPAKLRRTTEGEDVVFELVAQGEVLESERYRNATAMFGLVGLPGESYEPPIPLLRFPFTVGESWEWAGVVSLGPTAKPAKASMTSGNETLNLSTGVSDCVLVTAALVVDTGSGGESKRALKFWFKPKVGILKREIASSTTREPRPEPSGSE